MHIIAGPIAVCCFDCVVFLYGFWQAPSITVCDGICGDADGVAYLSDSFEMSWQVRHMSQCLLLLPLLPPLL